MDFYLLVKSLHIISMVCWFAGLFYLPRLFVYHASATPDQGEMLKIMEYKLYKFITNPAMIATWGFGGVLIYMNPSLLTGQGWLHAKLMIVFLLTGYHHSLNKFRKNFEKGCNQKSEKFFRLYNEIPSFILIVVIILAVIKPF